MRGVCTDVTAEEEAEQALRESEERFRTLADNIAQFAWMADANGWIFWYNRRWYEYTGTTLADVEGWGWTKVHHPDHVDRVVAGIERCWETGEPWEDTFPLRGRDGQYRWFLSRALPIRDEAGTVVRWLGTNTDITEQRAAEEERARLLAAEQAAHAEAEAQRHRYLDLVQGLDAIVWEADARTFQFTFVSRQAEAVLGYPVDRWLQEPHFWADHMHPDDRGWAVDYCVKCTAAREDHQFEYRILAADGRTVWLRDIVHVVVDAAGEPVALRGVMIDITDRKQVEAERERLLAQEQAARAQAEAALRMREALVSFATHDLRTPLTTIKGQARMLERLAARDRLTPEVLAAGLAHIGAAGATMEALTGELLDAVRLEAGHQLDLHLQPTDLVALARRCAAEQQRTTDRHTIRVVTRLGSLVGAWDETRLERVVANLLTNAIKYSPAGGVITIALRRRRDHGHTWAELSVRDQGIGIAAADLPRIFEQFHRAASVTGRIVGSGIGLAGVKQLVEQHGGTVDVASTEGRGSTFAVRLPLALPRDAGDTGITPDATAPCPPVPTG
jgi:PAS domain S-box-containing protein